jgi:hypothetical protein
MSVKTLAAVLFALVAVQAQPAPDDRDRAPDQNSKDRKAAFAKHKGDHKKKRDSRQDKANRPPTGPDRKAANVELSKGGDQKQPGYKFDRGARNDVPQAGSDARKAPRPRKGAPDQDGPDRPPVRQDRERPAPEPEPGR